MTPKPNARLSSLLRYTYQANMVFFAGFATWYFLKSPEQEALQEPHRHSANDDSPTKS
jgi:hypothetical protein